MRKLLTVCLLLLSSLSLKAQVPYTVTGHIQDIGGAAATTGTVIFTLQPASLTTAYRIQGTGLIAPAKVTCSITGASPNLSCSVWGNDQITPGGTAYQVTFKPSNIQAAVWNNVQVNNACTSLDTPCFGPPSIPQSAFVIPSGSVPNNLFPAADAVFSLGSPALRWLAVNALTWNVATLNVSTLNASGNTSVGGNLAVTGTTAFSGAQSGIADKGGQVFNVKAYGAKCDGVTDDLAAFNAAIAAVPNAASGVGAEIVVPPIGTAPCFLSGSLSLSRETILTGAGGQLEAAASELMFAPGVEGIVVESNLTSPPNLRGDRSLIRNLTAVQARAKGTTASGSNQVTAVNTSPPGFGTYTPQAPDWIIITTSSGVNCLAANTTVVSSSGTSPNITLTISANATANCTGAQLWKAGLLLSTGSTQNGNQVITSVTNTSAWHLGDPIGGAGIPANNYVIGCVVDANNTCGGGTTLSINVAPTVTASGVNLFKGPAVGIRMKARARVQDSLVTSWPGNGVDISSAGGTNVNASGVHTLRIYNVGNYGFHVQGGNANAGLFEGLDISGAAGGGIQDDSFLGNTYVMSQVAACGGSPMGTSNSNAINVFVYPYVEGSQGATTLAAPAIVIGGNNLTLANTATFFQSSGILHTSLLGNTPANRLQFNKGTALAVGDFAISAGWGTGASVSNALGTDTSFYMNIASGTGTGANPTFTFTFHDGSFGNGPIAVVTPADQVGTVVCPVLKYTTTPTTLVVTVSCTPTASTNYSFSGHIFGR